MQRVPALSAEKPAARQESLAADCFPGRQTSRRTMTFFVSSDEEIKKGRRKEREKTVVAARIEEVDGRS